MITKEKDPGHTNLSELSDAALIRQLPLEMGIMQKTDPEKIEQEILSIAATFPPDEQQLVVKANDFIKNLYKKNQRKDSKTAEILHPYRLVLAGDTTAGYKIATKLLHDAMEDFNVTADQIRELYSDINHGIDGERIVKGVEAFTRGRKANGEKEGYNDYIARLRDTARRDSFQAYLIGDKLADNIQNCLDPVALPLHIQRTPGIEPHLNKMLKKYEDSGPILLGQNDFRLRKLGAASELCRRGQTRQNVLLAA